MLSYRAVYLIDGVEEVIVHFKEPASIMNEMINVIRLGHRVHAFVVFDLINLFSTVSMRLSVMVFLKHLTPDGKYAEICQRNNYDRAVAKHRVIFIRMDK